MEYQILKTLRLYLKLPFIIRLFFGIFLIILSIIPIILPLFPGSLVVGVFMLVTGIITVISPVKIRHIIKVRKALIYLFMNLHNKHIIKHKINDIKKHINHILKKD